MTRDNMFIGTEDLVKTLTNGLSCYIFWKDKKGVYVGCNELFAQYVGLARAADIVGKTDKDLPVNKKQTLKTNEIPLRNQHGEEIGILNIGYQDLAKPQTATKITAQQPVKNKTLLLVEDENVAAHAAKDHFESLGYQITWVKNGETALVKASLEDFDLMVCDIALPGLNGIETVKKCREKGIYFPIFALTSHTDRDEQEFLAAGFNGLLIKPLTQEKSRQIMMQLANTSSQDGEENKLLDIAEAMSNHQYKKELILELLELFAQSLPSELEALKVAAEANDVSEIRKILHRMRGGAAHCGIIKFLNVMAKAHEEIKQNNGRNVTEILAPLYPVGEETLLEIRKMVG